MGSAASSTAKNNETFHQKQFEKKIVDSGQYGSVPTFVVDSVCKITTNEGVGSGFFAEFELSNRYMYGIFTCNHVLNADYIRQNDISCSVEKGDLMKRFSFPRNGARFTFTDESLDATFVELLKHEVTDVKQFGAAFLKVVRDKEKLKKGMTLGIPQHPLGDDRRVATAVLKKVQGCDITHLVNTLPGSSGSPLIDEKGAAVGIHKAGDTGCNVAVSIADVLLAIGNIRAQQMKPTTGIQQTGDSQETEPAAGPPYSDVIELPVTVSMAARPASLAGSNSPPISLSSVTGSSLLHTLHCGESVAGLTLLDGELFVLLWWQGMTTRVTRMSSRNYVSSEACVSSRVCVYDLAKVCEQQSQFELPHVEEGKYTDLTSCAYSRCLYIGRSKSYREGEVCRISGLSTDEWNTDAWDANGPVSGLSVARNHNLLVSSGCDCKLKEFTPYGELVREITLNADGAHLQHAVQLTNGQLVVGVSYGDSVYEKEKHPETRVCIALSDGRIIYKCGTPEETKLNKQTKQDKQTKLDKLYIPSYLAVDEDGFILVADSNSRRVLLLSPTLSYVSEVVSRDHFAQDNEPSRLSLDVDGERLFVADKNQRVLILRLRQTQMTKTTFPHCTVS